MRPRFRVWDKEEKKMIYDAEHFNNACDLNVLGNIYENKELLNAQIKNTSKMASYAYIQPSFHCIVCRLLWAINPSASSMYAKSSVATYKRST